MRKFVAQSFVALSLVIGAGFAVPVAYAAVGDTCPLSDTRSGTIGEDGLCHGSIATAPNTPEQAQLNAAQNTPTNPGADQAPKADGPLAQVMVWIMTLFAWLLGVAAVTLNYAVYYTVVAMGGYVKDLTAVGMTWRILRDIGNIMLIFGFLAVGISVILNSERLGWGKKLIPMLVFAAIFLNFSLFISEAVIDVGNLFATQFYTQINGGKPATAANMSDFFTAASNDGIANKVLSQLGLTTIYRSGLTNSAAFSASNTIVIGFMSIIVFIIASFVFFALALILVARFVFLLYLIITSPVGFAGWAIPKLSGLSSKWWSNLIDQTITAPILLLLLYIAIAVITDGSFLAFGGAPDWTGVVQGTNKGLAGFGSVVLSFVIAMGLLMVVVIVAKKLSAAGTSLATKAAGAVTFGVTGYGLRYSAGMASNYLARKTRENKLLNKTWPGRIVGRKLAQGFDAGATANYHLGAAVNKVPGMESVEYGKTHQGGYRAEKEITDKYKKSTEEAQKEVTKRQRISDVNRARAQSEVDIAAAARRRDRGEIPPEEYDRLVAMSEQGVTSALSKLSAKEIEELDDIKKGTEALVKNLSPQQFEALMKSDNLSTAQKENIKTGRFKDVSVKLDAASAPGATSDAMAKARTAIAKMNAKELEHMGTSLTNNAFAVSSLTPQQFESLMKSDSVPPTMKSDLQKARFKDIADKIVAAEDTSAPQPVRDAAIKAAREAIGKINTKELVHISPELLKKDFMIDSLSNDQYDALGKEGALSWIDKTALDARRKGRFDPTVSSIKQVADAIRSLKGNPEQIKKLPAATVTNRAVLDELGLDALPVIHAVRRGDLSLADRQSLGIYFKAILSIPSEPRRPAFEAYLTTNPKIKEDLLFKV